MPEVSMVPAVPVASKVSEVAKVFEEPELSEVLKLPETGSGAGSGAGAMAVVPEVPCSGVCGV